MVIPTEAVRTTHISLFENLPAMFARKLPRNELTSAWVVIQAAPSRS